MYSLGDGFLDMKELEVAMKSIDEMGVPGSKWKFYVDPAQDVICYHNFHTGEKIFEYQMKDDKLRVFLQINMKISLKNHLLCSTYNILCCRKFTNC